jgi:anti-anti-sigma regulatory factor
MAFSFFKKQPEKMVARPAAVPRQKDAGQDVSVPASPDENQPPVAVRPGPLEFTPAPIPVNTTQDAQNISLDFSDFVFSESLPDSLIEAEIDPVDAQAEEAAVLFANGQDEAVCSVLEKAVRIHSCGPGERLWLMLFDFYRISGQKTAFETLEIDYARSFEKSPPGWRDKSESQPKAKEAVPGSLLFRGELTGDNLIAFETIRQALVKNPRLRLDLSKVSRLDAEGCGHLLTLLQQGRKSRREIELLGRETLGVLVQKHVETGRAEDKDCWLLFLELCQLQGQHEIFEDVAINYAVTFEVSPPSWEPDRVALPEPDLPLTTMADGGDVPADAYVLRGEIKSSRFADLPAYAAVHDLVLIDCAKLMRMDFISAGALLNSLATIRRTGKQIVFHHPNHLVAELFGVVGLKAVATIVFAKH